MITYCILIIKTLLAVPIRDLPSEFIIENQGMFLYSEKFDDSVVTWKIRPEKASIWELSVFPNRINRHYIQLKNTNLVLTAQEDTNLLTLSERADTINQSVYIYNLDSGRIKILINDKCTQSDGDVNILTNDCKYDPSQNFVILKSNFKSHTKKKFDYILKGIENKNVRVECNNRFLSLDNGKVVFVKELIEPYNVKLKRKGWWYTLENYENQFLSTKHNDYSVFMEKYDTLDQEFIIEGGKGETFSISSVMDHLCLTVSDDGSLIKRKCNKSDLDQRFSFQPEVNNEDVESKTLKVPNVEGSLQMKKENGYVYVDPSNSSSPLKFSFSLSKKNEDKPQAIYLTNNKKYLGFKNDTLAVVDNPSTIFKVHKDSKLQFLSLSVNDECVTYDRYTNRFVLDTCTVSTEQMFEIYNKPLNAVVEKILLARRKSGTISSYFLNMHMPLEERISHFRENENTYFSP